MKWLKNSKGFTLIEMVVVIVIIGIITGVSISVVSSVNANNVSKGMPAIQSALEYGRNKTMVSASTDVYVNCKVDGKHYYATIYEGSNVDKTFKVFSSKYTFSIKVNGVITEEITDFTFRFNKSDGSLHSITVISSSGTHSLSLSPDSDIRLYVEFHEDDALVVSPLSGRTVKQ